jgi:hypothetical protein
VRATTWDELTIKPAAQTHIRVACIVALGAPGSCVPASSVASDSKTIDWAKARDDNDKWAQTASPADVALLRTVTERLQTARTLSQPTRKSLFVIKFFDEVVSPDDVRPPFVAKETLAIKDITLTKPIDASLLSRIYPVSAIRNGVAARVNMQCDIEINLRLLCRDQGTINLVSTGASETVDIIRAFRFATYQFASTLQLMPKDKNGNDVVGRQLKFAMTWQLPK